MRKWVWMMVILYVTPLAAQSTSPTSGYCTLGATAASVSGLSSTNKLQGVIPGCTVTVYQHGTQTKATIYADSSNTPLSNPFTANVASSPNSGGWIFWAANSSCYDVVGSGGVSPNTYPAPVTLTEVCPGGGGGGGGGTGTVTNNGSLLAGEPVYGNGAAVVQTANTEILADMMPGADICVKAMAAIAALPTLGGVVAFSATSYPPCSSPITVNKKDITLKGAGVGQVQGLSDGATILNFAAGVPGIIFNGAHYGRITGMTLLSASTVAGSDNGIYVTNSDSPVIEDVALQGFGGIGVWMSETTDFWYMHRVWVDHIKGNGFEWSGVSHGGCGDINLGRGITLSATAIGGAYAYNIQCGVNNVFEETHAAGDAHGDYNVASSYTFFRDIYSEAGGTFTVQPGTIWNQYNFTLFGFPTIIDNGVTFANDWHVAADAGVLGTLPGQNALNILTMPGVTPPQYFQWTVDNSAGLSLIDYKNGGGSTISYNPGMYTAAFPGWTFYKPVRVISPMRLDGYLDFSGQTPANPPTGICRVYEDSVTGNMIGKKSDGSACLVAPTGGGVTSINAVSGAFSFTGTGVSCTGTSCTFSGGGGSAVGASGDLQKNNGTGGFAVAAINDNGTTLTASEPICVGASCPVSCGSATGCNAYTEASTPCTPTVGEACTRADASHNIMWAINGVPEKAMPLIAPTGTANQAVCLLSSNPPILGKCTSVVGAGGACTCVSF